MDKLPLMVIGLLLSVFVINHSLAYSKLKEERNDLELRVETMEKTLLLLDND